MSAATADLVGRAPQDGRARGRAGWCRFAPGTFPGPNGNCVSSPVSAPATSVMTVVVHRVQKEQRVQRVQQEQRDQREQRRGATPRL